MNYAKLMEVLDSRDDLLVKLASLRFFQALVLDDVVEELSAWDILSDKVELLWRLNDFVELNNVGVPC